MAQYIQLPNGAYFQLKEGETPEQAILAAASQYPEAFETQQAPAAPAAGPKEGIGAALRGGAERFISTGRTALGALTDAEGAAQAGVARSQDISQRFAPATSLERVQQAYRERGLLPAAGEVISQIPGALAEQALSLIHI